MPAVLILLFTSNPSQVLLLSQVLLSFGLPFALIPLVYLTSQKKLMAEMVNKKRTIWLGVAIAFALVVLNLKLVLDSVLGLFA